MLTLEMLQQSTQLAALTAEQRQAIVELSRNDENTVIGARIGALHGQYDSDIVSITGIVKNAGEKSYDYLKRVLTTNKTDLDTLKTTKQELTTAKAKITSLEKKIAEGAQDETIKQQLKDTVAQVAQLQAQLTSKQEEFDREKQRLQQDLHATHVDYAFNEAVSGLKFKAGITEGIQKTLLSAAKAEVLSKGTPEFQQNPDGSSRLVFRGQDGNVLNNPKNNLNPYTFSELIMETSIKDVIDTGKAQPGGGTGPNHNPGAPTGGSSVDISTCKTQLEADKAIESYLLAEGLTRDSDEFSDRFMTIRNESNVASLPIR